MVKFSYFLRTIPKLLGLFLFLLLLGCQNSGTQPNQSPSATLNNKKPTSTQPQNKSVPDYAYQLAEFVAKNGRPPKGYVGGRTFQNREKKLPRYNNQKQRIRYKEYDVFPKRSGKNRGAERIVLGDDNSRFYTFDHYSSFIKF